MCDFGEIFDVIEEICQTVCEGVPYVYKSTIDDGDEPQTDDKFEPSTDETSPDPQTTDDYSTTNETSSDYFTTVSEGQSTTDEVDSSVSELPSTVVDEELSSVVDESGTDESSTDDDDGQQSSTGEESLKTEDALSDVADDVGETPAPQVSEDVVKEDAVAAACEKVVQKDSSTTIVEEPPLDWPGNNEDKPTPDATVYDVPKSELIADEAEEKPTVVIDDEQESTKEEKPDGGGQVSTKEETPDGGGQVSTKEETPDGGGQVSTKEETPDVDGGGQDPTKEEEQEDEEGEWPVVDVEANPASDDQPSSDSAPSTRDPFLCEIDELFEQMNRKNFCFNVMNVIAERGADIIRQEAATGLRTIAIPLDTMKIAADRLQAAVGEVDIRVRTNYLNVFYALFMLSHDFKGVMHYVYSLHFKADLTAANVAANSNGEKALPHLHAYFTRYESVYTDVLRDVSKYYPNGKLTHQEMNPLFAITRRLAFLLTISPRATLRRLVIDQVTKERGHSTANITKFLRHIPSLFELRLPNQGQPGKPCSVMVALIYRFWFTFTRSERNGIDAPDIDFADKEQCERMLSLLSIFTATRRHRESRRLMFNPVFDPNELVVDFIVPQLSPGTSHTALSLNFTLDLLDRLLRRRSDDRSFDEWIIRWKGETQICGELAADFGAIVGYLADHAVSNQFGSDVTQKCFKLIRRLIDIAEAKVKQSNNSQNGDALIMRTDLTKNVQPTGSSRHSTTTNPCMMDLSKPPPTFTTERVFLASNEPRPSDDRRPMNRSGGNGNDSHRVQHQQHNNNNNDQRKSMAGGAGYQQHERSTTMPEARGSGLRALQDTTNYTIINMPATERFQPADRAAVMTKRQPPPSLNDGDTSSQQSGYGEIPASLAIPRTSLNNSQRSSRSGRQSKSKNRRNNGGLNIANTVNARQSTSNVFANENGAFRGHNNDGGGGQRNRNRQSR